jgi:hypothetical protein
MYLVLLIKCDKAATYHGRFTEKYLGINPLILPPDIVMETLIQLSNSTLSFDDEINSRLQHH